MEDSDESDKQGNGVSTTTGPLHQEDDIGTSTQKSSTAAMPLQSLSSAPISSAPSSSFKRRKRGRQARVVPIHPSTTSASTSAVTSRPVISGSLQYTTTLVRRAIRKRPEEAPLMEEAPDDDDDDDEYGDISLGMKLIVAGGKVIVQTLNALEDGRASPAQLTGVIQRGDVLLAVGDTLLTQLPIDQLMTSLQPLSTPETPDGRYRRTLMLRLEAGTGRELLQSHERGMLPPPVDTPTAVVNDMFALFPMVDQLSGAPLFEAMEEPEQKRKEDIGGSDDEMDKVGMDEQNRQVEAEAADDLLNTSLNSFREALSPDEMISALVAKEQSEDRRRFASLYFNMGDGFPDLLRATFGLYDTSDIDGLTKTQRIELGVRVMHLAERLTHSMEEIEKGKDLRSFKMWSTNFSMRSGATSRRRAAMDAVSLRSHRHRDRTPDASDSDDENVESDGIDENSQASMDPDTLLLGLAAHDNIWREQVVKALQDVKHKMENGQDDADEEQENEKKDEVGDIDSALSNQLGNFLFGDKINQFVKKKKKSYALPPEDITTVLFDLTTHITTSAPDEVTIFGGTTNSFSIQSSFDTQARAKSQLRADVMLATRFLLDDVLPVWLETFRPLGLEHRRLFWPKLRNQNGTTAHISDNDSLTIDSYEAIPKSSGRSTKNLEQLVEDLELDVETRSETCFLVTYYFSQKILTKYSSCISNAEQEMVDEEVSAFLKRFGTYLQIHACLVYSAKVEARQAIDRLLDVARFDPLHREATKELRKATGMTFYEATKLSALLVALRNLRHDKEPHREIIKNLCVAAYPDVQPWQVRVALLDSSLADEAKTAMSHSDCQDLYYKYLSELLDPSDGHESARRNSKLVKEWCQWSTGFGFEESYRSKNRDQVKNFYQVASRTSSAHLSFYRDLMSLLEMSMFMKEYDLALELSIEILENRKLCGRSKDMNTVLLALREVASFGLDIAWKSKDDSASFHMLKRVLRVYHQMSTSSYSNSRESIDVPQELLSLLNKWEMKSPNSNKATPGVLFLMLDFMTKESAPSDVLSALSSWPSTRKLGRGLYVRLEALLSSGAQIALKNETSASLLRLKHIRSTYRDENAALGSGKNPAQATPMDTREGSIWLRLSSGRLVIDK